MSPIVRAAASYPRKHSDCLLPCDIQVIMMKNTMKKILMMVLNLTRFFSDHKDSCDLRERAMP